MGHFNTHISSFSSQVYLYSEAAAVVYSLLILLEFLSLLFLSVLLWFNQLFEEFVLQSCSCGRSTSAIVAK
jgi:hypothetical protein